MFCVLVRSVNFTARSTPGYCTEPPKPPNAGMQSEPALALSFSVAPPYLLVVCWPLQPGGAVVARVKIAGAGTVPLVVLCEPAQPANMMTAAPIPKPWWPMRNLIILPKFYVPGPFPGYPYRGVRAKMGSNSAGSIAARDAVMQRREERMSGTDLSGPEREHGLCAARPRHQPR